MLTEQDIAVLLEAMGLWERQHADQGFSKSMLGLLTGKPAIDTRTGTIPDMEEGRAKDADNAEVAILIKAKLVQLKRDAQSRYDQQIRDGMVPNG